MGHSAGMSTGSAGAGTRVFFVHLMKTGGTSVLYHALETIEKHEVWGPVFDPGPSMNLYHRLDRYTSVKQIWALGDWQLRSTRLFMGHFPWSATELVDPTVITATVLRDPVERTVSYLRHCKQRHQVHTEMALEEIYEDTYHFPRFVLDHQTKMLSMTLAEVLERPPAKAPSAEAAALAQAILREMPPGAFMFEAVDPPLSQPAEVGRPQLDVALANLERVEVLGIQERYDEWLARLSLRAGWSERPAERRNVSDPGTVSASFRRRIEADNAFDVELYERARELVEATART